MKLTHRTGVKILAVIVCLVTMLAGMLSAAGIVIMEDYGFYNNFGIENQESLENSFLNYHDYGYYDVSEVYEDLASHMDSWQLFYDRDTLISFLADYVDTHYSDNSRYGIKVTDINGNTLFSSVEEGDAIYSADHQEYQQILSSSLQQYADWYGYDSYYEDYESSYDYDDGYDEEQTETETVSEMDREEGTAAAAEAAWDAETSETTVSVQSYGVYGMSVYKGLFSYRIYRSNYLQLFYIDMTEAEQLFGMDQIMEMLRTGQAYVYSYNLRQDLTDTVGTSQELENKAAATKLVFTNLYSKLDEQDRVLNFAIYLDKNQVLTDYGQDYEIYSKFYELRYMIIVVFGSCVIFFMIAFVYLLFACGHRGESDEVFLNVIDRIPTDVYLAGMLVIAGILLVLFSEVLYYSSEVLLVIPVYAMFLLAFAVILSCTTRLKAGTLWRSALIAKLFSWIGKWITVIVSGMSMVWRSGIAMGVVLAVNIYAWLFFGNYVGEGWAACLMILLNLAVFILALVFLIGYRQIGNAAKQMAEGQMDYQLDIKKLHMGLRQYGSYMNRIGSNLEEAVEEQMKSERMKTELITNVSHDIKTPLTSIINYVDLLKKEEMPDETARQYLEVIDRQSARLKKLIVDLIEASKASTGNIEVHPVPTDVNELLLQTTGEYEQKAGEKNLELVVNLLPETGSILADGRHIWRVLDNLLGNAVKYALEGTRIYVDCLRVEGQIAISVKNISSARLNISTEELKERFVRGDSSRNTEGSGLGLSIAESLTVLQGGTLSLEIDGDLFKCVLLFPEIHS
jgi:signal transduction histidine kinase